MIKSKALVRAETKLKQLQKALQETEKRIKLLALKDAQAVLVKQKSTTKKVAVKKNKSHSSKRKIMKQKARVKAKTVSKVKI